MEAIETFVLLVCGGSLIFVFGALTGRAFAIWSLIDDERRLREEIRRLGRAVIVPSPINPSA